MVCRVLFELYEVLEGACVVMCRCVGSAVVKSSMGAGVPGELARIEATLHLQKLATGFNAPGRTVPVPMRGEVEAEAMAMDLNLNLFKCAQVETAPQSSANRFHSLCSHSGGVTIGSMIDQSELNPSGTSCLRDNMDHSDGADKCIAFAVLYTEAFHNPLLSSSGPISDVLIWWHARISR